MVQNGPNDHFGPSDLFPNWILAFARPKWSKMVRFGIFWPGEAHFGPFRSANRTQAIPDVMPLRQTLQLAELFLPLEGPGSVGGSNPRKNGKKY